MTAGDQGEEAELRLADRVVRDMLEADAFSRWLGIELVAIAPGTATVRMRVRPEMTNGFGVGHGGVTFALADSAFAFACNTHGRVTMSVDSAMSYPVSVAVGDRLTAIAVEESTAGPLGFYRVTVMREDRTTVALFRGTAYRTKRPHRAAEELENRNA